MRPKSKWISGGAAVAVVVAGGAVTMAAASGDDNEPPITGDALEKAGAAALEHTGGGTVTDTEIGDEEGYYEVEVTLENGEQVDVHLDDDFTVLSEEAEVRETDDP